MASNKHFLGVINLYARVTLGIGMAASIPAIMLAYGGGEGGAGQQLLDSDPHPSSLRAPTPFPLLCPPFFPCPAMFWAIPFLQPPSACKSAPWLLVPTQVLKTAL